MGEGWERGEGWEGREGDKGRGEGERKVVERGGGGNRSGCQWRVETQADAARGKGRGRS